VFLDESGFMLQPVRRRTWAPRGQTPIQRAWDRHDRRSAIAVLALSVARQRTNLYFQLLPHNVCADDMIWFLNEMHRHLGRTIILVWDRSSVHRSAAKYFEQLHPAWFQFEWLPPYAPDLNPTEQIWNHTKYSDLANFIPQDVEHLDREVGQSFRDQQDSSKLLRSFFQYTGLDL
jgi:transposase